MKSLFIILAFLVTGLVIWIAENILKYFGIEVDPSFRTNILIYLLLALHLGDSYDRS